MEDVSLDQDLSPTLPHLQQLVPADVELLEPLLQGGLRQRRLLGLQQLIHGLQALVVLLVPVWGTAWTPLKSPRPPNGA